MLTTDSTIDSSVVMPCALTEMVPPTEKEQYDCIVRGERPCALRKRMRWPHVAPGSTVTVSVAAL
jgi:hypothetical protein